jgi:hypothetical protein
MTKEQIKKCNELSAERDKLDNFRNYLVSHTKEWWEVISANDYSMIKYETNRGVVIPHCLRAVLINETERRIANIDEQLKEL